jgi:hypothetical protein
MRPIEEMLEEAEMANAESRQRWEAGQSGQHDFLVAEEFKQLREGMRVYGRKVQLPAKRGGEKHPESPSHPYKFTAC